MEAEEKFYEYSGKRCRRNQFQVSMDSPNPQSPSSIRTIQGTKSNQSQADLIISSLLSFPDSSPNSISCSFDRVLDKALASASADESVQDRLLDRTINLASLLLDSTNRCFRKRASVHNSNSWFLPLELTVKVLSMLDTKSLMQAAASCTMFNKCAMDRLCYSHIDLTTSAKSADKGVVSTMINRAGKELRSLKLGRVIRTAGYDSTASDSTASLLGGSCLKSLAYNHGFLGSRLRSLRLYNLRPMKYKSLCVALSVCSNITDLKIVGLYNLSEELFKSLTIKCCLIEHLFLETYDYSSTLDTKTGSSLVEFVANCPNLTYLTLIRFGLTDGMVRNLAESSRKLEYLNLSRSSTIKGRFLRDLGLSCKDGILETLILRNCPKLQEKEVLEFCNSLLRGNFKSIRHIDISNNRGVASDRGKRCYKPNLPVEKLEKERSDVTFVADFPLTSSDERHRVCDEEESLLIEMMEAEDDEWDSDSDSDSVSDSDDSDDDEDIGVANLF